MRHRLDPGRVDTHTPEEWRRMMRRSERSARLEPWVAGAVIAVALALAALTVWWVLHTASAV